MTGRQITVGITVGLCALALAGCHKKAAEKPPAPKAETPATPPSTPSVAPPTEAPATPPADTGAATPSTTPPSATVDPTGLTPTPPTPGVTPTTTADAPPTFVPIKPIRVLPKAVIKLAPRTPGQTVTGGPAADQTASQRPPIRIGKTAAQAKAEKDILGLWIEQKHRDMILNFTTDGAVAYREKITDTPQWTGHWKAGADGVVQFDLGFKGAQGGLQFSAYPTAAQIMAIAPHWTKEWGGSGQYAYERMK
ncbi:MAG: hypothetical protein J7515_06590 [Caulobacter sp.]|nr:hypothetical protein [Caulobacter sp.]